MKLILLHFLKSMIQREKKMLSTFLRDHYALILMGLVVLLMGLTLSMQLDNGLNNVKSGIDSYIPTFETKS